MSGWEGDYSQTWFYFQRVIYLINSVSHESRYSQRCSYRHLIPLFLLRGDVLRREGLSNNAEYNRPGWPRHAASTLKITTLSWKCFTSSQNSILNQLLHPNTTCGGTLVALIAKRRSQWAAVLDWVAAKSQHIHRVEIWLIRLHMKWVEPMKRHMRGSQ